MKTVTMYSNSDVETCNYAYPKPNVETVTTSLPQEHEMWKL